MMSIAVLSPMEFAYSYGGPGHTAITRGEAIYLAKCQVTSVIPDVNATGCFNELPVVNDGKKQFMSPRSRILTNVGTQIDCLPDMPSLYLFGDQWFRLTPNGLIRAESPLTMIHGELNYKFTLLEGLGSGGLYNDETISQYQKALISGITTDILSNRVTASIEGKHSLPEGYSWVNGFTDKDFSVISSKVTGW